MVGSVPTLAGRTAWALADVSTRLPELHVNLQQIESAPAGRLAAQRQLDLAVIDVWLGNTEVTLPGVTVLPRADGKGLGH